MKVTREELAETLQALVAEGSTIYDGDWDEIGICRYCHKSSYRSHEKSCKFGKAEELLARLTKEG